MPPRACIECGRPTPNGASRHRACGGRTPTIRLHDSRQNTFRREVLAKAKRENRWYCHECGLPPTPDNPLQAGHIIALSLGGTFHLSNGQPECRRCNISKGGRNRLRSNFSS